VRKLSTANSALDAMRTAMNLQTQVAPLQTVQASLARLERVLVNRPEPRTEPRRNNPRRGTRATQDDDEVNRELGLLLDEDDAREAVDNTREQIADVAERPNRPPAQNHRHPAREVPPRDVPAREVPATPAVRPSATPAGKKSGGKPHGR
jgi:hypothetical protein